MIGVTALALALSALRLARRFMPILNAGTCQRTDHLGLRLRGALSEFILHRRLLRSKFAGTYHAVIVISFLLLIATKVRSFAEILAPDTDILRWSLPFHDVAVAAMLAAVAAAVVNRQWLGHSRFAGSNHRDAAVILGAISIIVLASETQAVAHVIAKPDDEEVFPIASAIARLFPSAPNGASEVESLFRWLHIGAILAFIIYVPGSKHLHVLTGLPNLLFRDLTPRGRLKPETTIKSPASTFAAQSWKALFDLYCCSECGRCQANCPAYAAGKNLSPKTLIMGLRDRLVSDAFNKAAREKPLAGSVIAPETLWACTTCYSCMAACPLHIEHIPKIMELRRSLVDEGLIEPALTKMLNGARRYGNVFVRPARQRPKWAEELDFEIPDAQQQEVEFLWFVGDHASFHPIVAEKTRQFARILKAAGVDFGILYGAERSSGNDIRRIGEEDLFQDLVSQNIAAIAASRFQTIVTTDPHTFNTLVNEYPSFGLKVTVLHHTELLAKLLDSGWQPQKVPRRLVTFHDPCYLGRYNGRYQPPRTIIERLGYDLREMPRNRENSFCCGGGGGRIFMTDISTGPRAAEIRLAEAATIEGLEWFVVACPKDCVMFGDAIKNIEASSMISIKEITDLFFDDSGKLI